MRLVSTLPRRDLNPGAILEPAPGQPHKASLPNEEGFLDCAAGWAYSSEIAPKDLVVGTPSGIANVFSVPDY